MPTHLSDGQKQRVSIGRAIVRQPAAFLMDEPISHLDAILRSRMRREIKHLQGELGITTVYVTHDQLEATAMADRIAVMNLGELQQVGTPQEIFESPANVFVADFVGEPPMNFLEMDVASSAGGIELKTDGLCLDIGNQMLVRALLKLTRPKVLVGIRPMHIQMCCHQADGLIPIQVYFVEPLDEFNIIAIQLGGKKLLVETEPEFCPEVDDTVWIHFPEEKLHLFDVDTQQNILRNGK
jgi:ABC-type sugar transport system ATPase subunit